MIAVVPPTPAAPAGEPPRRPRRHPPTEYWDVFQARWVSARR